ncbi:hypothetical protein [Nautilia lithotrophica]
MKKMLIFLILFIFVKADVFTIINDIKKMQLFNPKFKKLVNYDIFNDYVTNKEINSETPATFNENIQINAIFQNRVNINGSWYKIGDIVSGYQIIKINNNKVIMKKNRKIKTLIIKSNILKVVK